MPLSNTSDILPIDRESELQRTRLSRRALIWAVAAPLLLSACFGSGDAIPDAPQALGPPPLAPGDRIKVAVYGQEALTVEADLDDAGTINVPLIGRVTLTGQPPLEAEKTIAGRLARGLVVDPKVSVFVVRYRAIYVLGEVVKPGAYEYTPNLTLLDAVALAGGYSRRARSSRVTIRRRDAGDEEARLASPSTHLLPGDVVEVPERYF